MDFGEKIKALRINQGMTLEQVGDIVGVGKSTVRKWETGQIANMRRDKIALLAKALGTTPAFLMGWNIDESENEHPVSNTVRNRINDEMSCIDPVDIEASREYMDVDLLETIVNRCGIVSIDDAVKASDMLGITINELIGEEPEKADEETITPDEKRLLVIYRALNKDGRRSLMKQAELHMKDEDFTCKANASTLPEDMAM